jgi:transcriptional regulator with XRE-family HTH domain
MKTIGERVRQLRREKGFGRQADLAKLVGVDQSVISDIENGSGFKADVLMALCEHLDTSAEYLMHGEDRATAGEAEILNLYRKTSDEGRTAMVVMARGLKENYPRHGSTTNMGAALELREKPDVERSQRDTVIANNHLELSFHNPSKSRTRDQSSSNPEQQPPERGEHAEGAPKARRSRRT